MRLRLTVLATVLACSCSIPLYERAEMSQGLSLGAGLSAEAAWRMPLIDPEHGFGSVLGLCLTPSLCVRYGFSDRAGMFLSGYLGSGWWLGLDTAAYHYHSHTPNPNPVGVDVRLGGKFRIGERGALLPALSFPGVIDLDYLLDFGPNLTGRFGLGLRGLSVGLNASRPLGDRLRGYVGLTVHEGWGSTIDVANYLPSVALGCALEWGQALSPEF